VLSPGVHVGPKAIIRDSVILTDCYIEAGAIIERCIIDKLAVIGKNSRLGKIQDLGDLGITVVGKNTRVPAGFTVGHGVVLNTDLEPEDFKEFDDKVIPNGRRVISDRRKTV
jgi:glucose-1-phosphate adenylyltransferase